PRPIWCVTGPPCRCRCTASGRRTVIRPACAVDTLVEIAENPPQLRQGKIWGSMGAGETRVQRAMGYHRQTVPASSRTSASSARRTISRHGEGLPCSLHSGGIVGETKRGCGRERDDAVRCYAPYAPLLPHWDTCLLPARSAALTTGHCY